ncbi:MAG: biotin--[acetyl-CoA-carboxylase] ligase [Oscillospiraceae bacterium]|nr:biotin--[acetyl-CoA-carboxylase] ligase [Oscillospiraceae bacterium]
MSTKNIVLALLESERERFISGMEIAQKLNISRAAVWKAVKSLEEDGHSIIAVTNKGYKLNPESDVLSAEGVRANLPEIYRLLPITVLDNTDSTNTQAKKLAADGAAHGTLILAEEQTSGRGRHGKSFFSPRGTGLYMSVILKPKPGMEEPQLVTAASAVAVCRAIEKLTDKRPGIKWVNDLFLDGKKVCGILTEAVTDFESGGIESIVVGIGVDCSVSEEELPTELQDVVGSIGGGLSRNRLAAEIATGILDGFGAPVSGEMIGEYRKRSLMLGKLISFTRAGESKNACVTGISDSGGLLVRLENGEDTELQSGEVTVLGPGGRL